MQEIHQRAWLARPFIPDKSYWPSQWHPAFVRDFVAAWDKVMNLDRFDLDPSLRNGS
jgi:hypothetical protein